MADPMTPTNTDAEREAGAIAICPLLRGMENQECPYVANEVPCTVTNCVPTRYANAAIDAFLAKALEGADEKLAGIQQNIDDIEANGFDPLQILPKTEAAEILVKAWRVQHDCMLALEIVTALSAKLTTQKAAHAKMLRDEADNWPEGSVESQVAEDFRRLADKIEGEP